MDPEFWRSRWRAKQIGFHRDTPHPALLRHHAHALSARGSRVFVPLCGKSVDLAWLHSAGHEVVGVELSPIAVREFFEERGLTPTIAKRGELECHRVPGIALYVGDFFALDPALLGKVDGYYDRAALVALPPGLRERYVLHLTSLLPSGTRGLVVSFEYLPPTGGPPFSVPEADVRKMYEPDFALSLLERVDILDDEPRFRERGITSLHECAYGLVSR